MCVERKAHLDFGQVLGETQEFLADLVGELASVTKNQGIDMLSGDQLLKNSEDEDGGLTHTRLGLTDDIHTQDCLRDAFLLDCRVGSRSDVSKCVRMRIGMISNGAAVIVDRIVPCLCVFVQFSADVSVVGEVVGEVGEGDERPMTLLSAALGARLTARRLFDFARRSAISTRLLTWICMHPFIISSIHIQTHTHIDASTHRIPRSFLPATSKLEASRMHKYNTTEGKVEYWPDKNHSSRPLPSIPPRLLSLHKRFPRDWAGEGQCTQTSELADFKDHIIPQHRHWRGCGDGVVTRLPFTMDRDDTVRGGHGITKREYDVVCRLPLVVVKLPCLTSEWVVSASIDDVKVESM